jgi:hypothetical protein
MSYAECLNPGAALTRRDPPGPRPPTIVRERQDWGRLPANPMAARHAGFERGALQSVLSGSRWSKWSSC